MTTFAVEPFRSVEKELRGLIFEHWQEVTSNPDTMPLDPDWEKYYALEAAGILFTLTARNNNGEMVGYIIHLIYPALHYKTVIMASDDAHFLKKEYRRGTTAWKMFKAAEVALKALGVHTVTYHSKTRPDINKRPVFERLGYKGHEVMFIKHLKET